MNKILHLGNGGLVIPGAINTDFDDWGGNDFSLDASAVPYPFEDNTLDKIINAHMIEHIEPHLVVPMLKEWYRILKPKGVVQIDCPHFKKCVDLYFGDDFEKAQEIIFGNNERPTQHHRAGYTPDTLASLLKRAGFTKVKELPSDDYHINVGIPTFRLEAYK